MKLLCLVALTVCAIAHGANIPEEILPPGISVSKDFESSQYFISLIAPNLEEIQDVLVSETEAKRQNTQERNLITGTIQDLLDDLRDVIVNGNESVPPLDPLVVPLIGPFEFRANGVAAEGRINNLRMEGLRWFLADRVDINPLRLSFGITFILPSLTITGGYDAKARVAILLTHTAAGNFRVFAHRIEVGFDMRMGTNIFGGGHLVLRELDIHIDIHDTHISISGMTGSPLINNFISATIQTISQDLIQSQLQNVSRLLSEELFDVINDVLKEFTVSDIFG